VPLVLNITTIYSLTLRFPCPSHAHNLSQAKAPKTAGYRRMQCPVLEEIDSWLVA